MKALYEKIWKSGEYIPSACAKPLAKYIMQTASKEDLLLDIGCGDGTTVRILRENGFKAYGVDLTLAGVKIPCEFLYESPADDMRIFHNDAFDYTFSTDVLEHLQPEKLNAVIQEILRITKIKTFHCMPIWGHTVDGIELHLIQKEPQWWIEQFKIANLKGIEVLIKERERFLQEMINGH